MNEPIAAQIATVRDFNRFYTRKIGVLDEGLLASDFTLTEARILFELAHRGETTAADLVRELSLDPGYLSRILKKLRKRRLLVGKTDASDGRTTRLALSGAGRAAFAPLDQASDRSVAQLLEPLPAAGRAELVGAMETIRAALEPGRTERESYLLRPHRPGDIGWIIHRQARIYHEEYGWDETYEALIAGILGEFVANFDPRHERAWIAERAGSVVGSVFVVRQSDEIARLRLLYVEPSARGLGLGSRLVDECVRFARDRGYRALTLWTNDVLVAARRIYQAAGFRLVESAPHHSFGHDLNGQTWTLDL
jgi:DNA-binding MarR family transcriptional regulator/N-acetylglutamate synthase-like GNAT family acetyltransferase